MAKRTSNATVNPPGSTQLPCGCVVQSRSGALGRCPANHTQDTPDHRRRWV